MDFLIYPRKQLTDILADLCLLAMKLQVQQIGHDVRNSIRELRLGYS
jgi:hypothetical protein